MLHWTKLPALILCALAIASALGKATPLGFFW
jgi:hypothetical protein